MEMPRRDFMLFDDIKEEIDEYDDVLVEQSDRDLLPINEVRIVNPGSQGNVTQQDSVIPVRICSVVLTDLLKHSTVNTTTQVPLTTNNPTKERGARPVSPPDPVWIPRIVRCSKEKGPETSQDKGTELDQNTSNEAAKIWKPKVMKTYNLRNKASKTTESEEAQCVLNEQNNTMDTDSLQFASETEEDSSSSEEEPPSPRKKRKKPTTRKVSRPSAYDEDMETFGPMEQIPKSTGPKRGRDMTDAEYRDFMVTSFTTLIQLTKELCRMNRGPGQPTNHVSGNETTKPVEQEIENIDGAPEINSLDEESGKNGGPSQATNHVSALQAAKQTEQEIEKIADFPEINTLEEVRELEEKLKSSSFQMQWIDDVVEVVRVFRSLGCSFTARKMMRFIFTTNVLIRMNYAGQSVYYTEDGEEKEKFKLKNSKIFVALVSILRKVGFKNFRVIKNAILKIVYKSKDGYKKQVIYQSSAECVTNNSKPSPQVPIENSEAAAETNNCEPSTSMCSDVPIDEHSTEQVQMTSESNEHSEQISTHEEVNTTISNNQPNNSVKIFTKITSVEELKVLDKKFKKHSFSTEWIDTVMKKLKSLRLTDCSEAARKMMKLVFSKDVWLRMNYAGMSVYDAGNGVQEQKFKLKNSKVFAVLVLILKKLGFSNFNVIKRSILNVVYKSKTAPTIYRPREATVTTRKRKRKIPVFDEESEDEQLAATKKIQDTSKDDNFNKISSIEEIEELEKKLSNSSAFTEWLDEVILAMQPIKSTAFREVARQMMRLVFKRPVWQMMNYAGWSRYDAGNGTMKTKFKLKNSNVFRALVGIMEKLSFTSFAANKKAILDIIYKSNQPTLNKQIQLELCQPIVPKHSELSTLCSEPELSTLCSEPEENSESSATAQVLFGNFELSDSAVCFTEEGAEPTSTVSTNFEPSDISCVDQVLTDYFENSVEVQTEEHT